MTAESFVSAVAALSGLLFVVASMLGTGLSLSVGQIVRPLKNVPLVILALVANLVLVPLLAYGITSLITLDEPLKIGPVVLSTVAGAPLLNKEVQFAKGDLALGVGLMFLMMIVTIIYVLLVLPRLLSGGCRWMPGLSPSRSSSPCPFPSSSDCRGRRIPGRAPSAGPR